jgi:hypothetical protein
VGAPEETLKKYLFSYRARVSRIGVWKMKSVVIFGAGIFGLSATHGLDLIKRKEFMTYCNNLLINNLTTAQVGYGDSQG